jgi:hypothetical protein
MSLLLLHLRAFSGSPAALICLHSSYDQHHGQQDKVRLMGLELVPCLCFVSRYLGCGGPTLKLTGQYLKLTTGNGSNTEGACF